MPAEFSPHDDSLPSSTADSGLRVQTPRLTLRALRNSDTPFLHVLLGSDALLGEPWDDAHAVRTRCDAPPYVRVVDEPSRFEIVYSPDRIESTVSRHHECEAENGFAFWLAERRDKAEPVGLVGPLPREIDGTRRIEIGWYIAPPVRRRGYATEAAAGCIDWVFDRFAEPAVYSAILANNVASQVVARRLGMRVVDEDFEVASLPHRLFAVSRAEWETRSRQMQPAVR